MVIAGYEEVSGSFRDYKSYVNWLENGKPPIPKPNGLKPIFRNIPDDLKERKTWLTWNYMRRDVSNPPQNGKIKIWTKKPNGKVNDTSTWTSFDDAVDMYKNEDVDGIGFIFKKNDGLTGIDFDNVIDSDGNVTPLVKSILYKAKSFTEFSPSGTGLHLYINADFIGGCRKDSIGIEIYGDSHYFTVTGHIPSFCKRWGITQNQPLADCLYKNFKNGEKEATLLTIPETPYRQNKANDNEVLQKIFSSNDKKAQNLFNGNWQQEEYQSQSEADLGFFKKLLYWTHGDISQAERIFEESGLNREKWAGNYKKNTIKKAVGN